MVREIKRCRYQRDNGGGVYTCKLAVCPKWGVLGRHNCIVEVKEKPAAPPEPVKEAPPEPPVEKQPAPRPKKKKKAAPRKKAKRPQLKKIPEYKAPEKPGRHEDFWEHHHKFIFESVKRGLGVGDIGRIMGANRVEVARYIKRYEKH